MAKINLAISAEANLLAQVNADNATLNATADQVTIGVPTSISGTGGRNTALQLTAVADKGFSGSQSFSYTRLDLVAGKAIATAKAVPVLILAADSDTQVATKVAAGLGLLASDVSLANIVRPVNENTPGSADVVAATNSLLYIGTYAAVLTVADADVPLSEAAPTTELTGFTAEA